jgi:hypothetical protein
MVYKDPTVIVHFGVKGMKWGVRKQAANIVSKTVNNRDARIAVGSRIVAAIIISHGSAKIYSYGKRKAKYTINKALNEFDQKKPPEERPLRETSRYYDRKLNDWVYSYGETLFKRNGR